MELDKTFKVFAVGGLSAASLDYCYAGLPTTLSAAAAVMLACTRFTVHTLLAIPASRYHVHLSFEPRAAATQFKTLLVRKMPHYYLCAVLFFR